MRSVNHIQHGRHLGSVKRKMKTAKIGSLWQLQLWEGRAGLFCELPIYRSSSTMFKLRVLASVQWDNFTNDVFSQSDIWLVWWQTKTILTWKWKCSINIIICAIRDTVQTGSIHYLSLFLHYHAELLKRAHGTNSKGRNLGSV